VQEGGVDCSPLGRVDLVAGGQLACPVEQQRGRARRTARTSVPGGLLEGARDIVVGLVRAGGELPGSRLWILQQLRQARMDLGTT